MPPRIYKLKIDEHNKFAKYPDEIIFSQHECGGALLSFEIPALWREYGCAVSLEYYNENAHDQRIRSRYLTPDEDGNLTYEICSDFTSTVGCNKLQLVGESGDGKVFKTILKSCPEIQIASSVNALEPQTAGDGNNIVTDLLSRIDAKADKSETYRKNEIDDLVASSEGAAADLSGILAAIENKADKSDFAGALAQLAQKADKSEIPAVPDLTNVARRDVVWQGMAYLSSEEGKRPAFPFNNLDYNKYSEFEIHFESTIFKIRKTDTSTAACALCNYDIGSSGDVFAKTVCIEIYYHTFYLSNCMYYYYYDGSAEVSTDATTVYKIVGIY